MNELPAEPSWRVQTLWFIAGFVITSAVLELAGAGEQGWVQAARVLGALLALGYRRGRPAGSRAIRFPFARLLAFLRQDIKESFDWRMWRFLWVLIWCALYFGANGWNGGWWAIYTFVSGAKGWMLLGGFLTMVWIPRRPD